MCVTLASWGTLEPMQQASPAPEDAPVLRHRARVVRLSSLGRRVGYLCFAGSMAVFFVGLALQFPVWTVTTIVALMLVGSVVLVPAIILGYGAKAADKEDRGEPWSY